jgi:hypothetical protein
LESRRNRSEGLAPGGVQALLLVDYKRKMRKGLLALPGT